MGRLRLWLLVGAVLLLVGGMAAGVIRTICFQKWHHPPVLAIPAEEEVAEMRIAFRPEVFMGNDAVAEFIVPREHVAVILGWLRPSEYIKNPWRLDMLVEGEAIIKERDGGEMRLRFYDAGVNPAVLTVDGVDQFYGPKFQGHTRYGGIGFGDAIRAAYRASRHQGERD